MSCESDSVPSPGGTSENLPAKAPSRINITFSSVFHFFSTLFADAWKEVYGWPLVKKLVMLAGLAVVLIITVLVDIPSIGTLRTWAESSGPLFIWLFCGLYILITQFPIPRTFLTLAAGVLFGPWLGAAVALGSTTVAAAISLVIVRGLLGDWMAPRLRHPAVERINTRLQHRGWLTVASLRMIAAVPFSILNYVAALTSVPLLAFTIATAVGSAPGTIAAVVLGDAFVSSGNFTALLFTVALACLGVLGIFLDQRLPVKSQK